MFSRATTERAMLPSNELRPVVDSDEARRTELREGKIARMAYYIWQVRGDQGGCAEMDWLIAERVFETGRFAIPMATC